MARIPTADQLYGAEATARRTDGRKGIRRIFIDSLVTSASAALVAASLAWAAPIILENRNSVDVGPVLIVGTEDHIITVDFGFDK